MFLFSVSVAAFCVFSSSVFIMYVSLFLWALLTEINFMAGWMDRLINANLKCSVLLFLRIGLFDNECIYFVQLSLAIPPWVGPMSSSLWATEWRPHVADWSGGMSATCTEGITIYCSLSWAMDDRIMCCGIDSSCQSAVTSEVNWARLESDSTCRLNSTLAIS